MYSLGTLSLFTSQHKLDDPPLYIIASEDEFISRRPLR
jgi:hypothetical protein